MDFDEKISNEYLFILEFEKFNVDFRDDITKQFDIEWYVEKYDIKDNLNPIIHYLELGFKKGFDPNPYFSTTFYLNENPDVKNNGINPYVHYLKYGIKEGRIPKMYSLVEFNNQKLKLTLKGRRKYLFLINDSNQELNQHFNINYKNIFDKKTFIEQYHYKKKVFNNLGIDYGYYVVPDKSIVCKDLLPFNPQIIKRNVEDIDILPNFTDFLNPDDYFKYDSHMNYEGGKKLAFKILNHLNNSFDRNIYKDIISNFSIKKESIHYYDLLFEMNWSYTLFEQQSFDKTKKVSYLIPKNLKCLHENIPDEFKSYKSRRSEHFVNENAFSNLKVLIFHDSSIRYLKWYFTFYFKEMFLYWDHGSINKELIKWYNPDLILEIRIERFLENIPVPDWVLNKEVEI